MRWLAFGFGMIALAFADPARAQAIVCDEAVIHAEARRAREWRYAWTGVNATLAIGSFAAAPWVDAESRPDWIVSGAGSALTAAATFLWPLDVEAASQELRALPPAACAARLPRLMRESAADERARVTWPWHVANVGLAALTGGIIAFGYDHHLSGLLTTVGGTALAELQLWTQPTGLPSECSAACSVAPRLFVSASAERWTGAGFALGGSF